MSLVNFDRPPNWLRRAIGLPQANVPALIGDQVVPTVEILQGGWAELGSDSHLQITPLTISGIQAANVMITLLDYQSPSNPKKPKFNRVLLALSLVNLGPNAITYRWEFQLDGRPAADGGMLRGGATLGIGGFTSDIGIPNATNRYLIPGNMRLCFTPQAAMVAADSVFLQVVHFDVPIGTNIY